MGKKQTSDTPSKRQILREQRQKKQKQQRLLIMLGLAGVGVILILFLVVPAVIEATTPVGEFQLVTPYPRPNVDGRAMGDPNAPVTIEVFEDFQCPACQTYSELIEPEIVKNLVEPGTVYYIFRHNPFIDDRAATKESDQAANASMCASEQGRFWDYHDILYKNWNGENQGNFTDKRLVAFAEAIHLDMTAFNACFKANLYQDEIEKDIARGLELGVNGTPSVFVNGKIVKPGYVPSYEEIKAAVNAALESSGN